MEKLVEDKAETALTSLEETLSRNDINSDDLNRAVDDYFDTSDEEVNKNKTVFILLNLTFQLLLKKGSKKHNRQCTIEMV